MKFQAITKPGSVDGQAVILNQLKLIRCESAGHVYSVGSSLVDSGLSVARMDIRFSVKWHYRNIYHQLVNCTEPPFVPNFCTLGYFGPWSIGHMDAWTLGAWPN